MSDEKKKETSESVSKAILNILDRTKETEHELNILAQSTKKFTDAVVEYVQRNDRNVDKLQYWSLFHFIVELVLLWVVFFK